MFTDPGHLFIFNPLTAFFLSGVVTQITLIFFFKNDHTMNNRNTILYSNSNRRIKRWLQMFNTYCSKYYIEYSEAYEKEEFDSLNQLNPFTVHSNLLIRYSIFILDFLQLEIITNVIKEKFKEWFTLFSHIKNSKVWQRHMSKENIKKIFELNEQYTNMKCNLIGCDRGKVFVDFNPVGLFIRSAFIVNLHQTHFSTKLFSCWEYCNVCVISKYFHIEDYLSDFHKEKQQINFSSNFPFINNLQCMQIYKLWDVYSRKCTSVPVFKIYTVILQLIYGNMITVHYHHRNQFNLPTNIEKANIVIFQTICSQIRITIIEELKKVIRNESHRRFRMKNKKEYYENKMIYDYNNPDEKTWGFTFIFHNFDRRFYSKFEHNCDGGTTSAEVVTRGVQMIKANKEKNRRTAIHMNKIQSRCIILNKIEYTEEQDVDDEGEEEHDHKKCSITMKKRKLLKSPSKRKQTESHENLIQYRIGISSNNFSSQVIHPFFECSEVHNTESYAQFLAGVNFMAELEQKHQDQQKSQREKVPINNEKFVVAKLNSNPISAMNFRNLIDHEWICDEVIDFIGIMLMCDHENIHIFSTHFMPTMLNDISRVQTWYKNISSNINFLYIPIHKDGNHWLLSQVNFKEKEILLWNSSPDNVLNSTDNLFYLEKLRMYIEHMQNLINDDNARWNGDWIIRDESLNCPNQKNFDDCGIFTILNMVVLVNDLDLNANSYSQELINKFNTRERIGQIIHQASNNLLSSQVCLSAERDNDDNDNNNDNDGNDDNDDKDGNDDENNDVIVNSDDQDDSNDEENSNCKDIYFAN